MEVGILSSLVSVILSLGVVLVTYVKTWVKLDTSISNLTNVVDRLTGVVDNLTQRQAEAKEEQVKMSILIQHNKEELERLEEQIKDLKEEIDDVNKIMLQKEIA